MVGATLYTYQNKTVTPSPTWLDKDRTAYNTNPIVLDARGEAVIWLDPQQSYTFVLRDWFGSLVWAQDDVTGAASGQDLTALVDRLSDTAESNGAAMIGFIQRFSGSVGRTMLQKARERVSVTDFGVFSNAADPLDNKATLQRAVDAVPAGCKLVIPNSDDGLPVVIDTSQGLSGAVKITQPIQIEIEGIIASNFGTMQANPPYIFDVQADGVAITGAGTIRGDGTVDDTNAGNSTTFPGLIRVTGDRFTFEGPTIDTPPKVGILLYQCKHARIQGRFIGGPLAYEEEHTAYFGVYTNAGSHHDISGNHFSAGADGGKFINCIFLLNTDYTTICRNKADAVYEKLAYTYGNRNIIAENHVNDSTITDSYRISGSYNKLIGNTAINTNGGCQVFDGVCNVIAFNTFIGMRQIGINVRVADEEYTGGFSGTKIFGNVITGALASGKVDGIRVFADGAESTGIDVSHNTVSNFAEASGEALIRVMALNTSTISNSRISNNIVDSGRNGVLVSRAVDSIISGNQANNTIDAGLQALNCSRLEVSENFWNNPGDWSMSLADTTLSRFMNNRSRNAANIGIENLDATGNYARGNQYGDSPLVGDVTLALAITTTVSHGGVAPNARVMLQEKNNHAGNMLVNKGRCYAYRDGANFVIRVANGTEANGDEQFHYEIIQ